MNIYPIQFVGAGPGDPELITVKGARALERADLVIYAGSLVPEAVLYWTPRDAEKVSSAGLHLEEIVSLMAARQEKGHRVVRLHSGDPSLYGAIAEQMHALDEYNIPYEQIPGVSAAFAAAASLRMEYTLPEVCQTLILTRAEGRTPVPETEHLRSLAQHQSSMAIYLSAGLADKVQAVLEESYGPDSQVAVVHKASHPDEQIISTTAKELAYRIQERGIKGQALIIAGPSLNSARNLHPASRLYDREFTHGYRQGEGQ